MIAELPVGIDDPIERLGAIRAQMDGLKESKQAVAGEVLTSLSGLRAVDAARARVRASRCGIPQRNVNTVTTNVPGPQHQLYACGRPMLEAFPFVPLASSVRVGVAIFSYNGMLNYGVTGDYDTAPDISVLVQRRRGRHDRAAQARGVDARAREHRQLLANVGRARTGALSERALGGATSAPRVASIALRPITARSAPVGWNVSTGVPAPANRARLRDRA